MHFLIHCHCHNILECFLKVVRDSDYIFQSFPILRNIIYLIIPVANVTSSLFCHTYEPSWFLHVLTSAFDPITSLTTSWQRCRYTCMFVCQFECSTVVVKLWSRLAIKCDDNIANLFFELVIVWCEFLHV